jgi:hypothetical protein
MVLSVAPVDETPEFSLAAYLAQEHGMGPEVPAELAGDPGESLGDFGPVNPMAFLSQAEGEGDGEGEGSNTGEGSSSGSGSGGGTGSSSGSGGGESSGSGSASGGGSGSGAGSGSGNGSGSGSGQGSGSSSSSGGDSQPPTVSDVAVEDTMNGTTVSGTLSDNGDPSGVTITLSTGDGEVTLDGNGGFTINVFSTDANGEITLNIADANGNVTVLAISV